MSEQTGGYVKLHRALREHPIFTQLSPTVLKLWIACLVRANWKATRWYDGCRQVEVPAGAFIFSQDTLAKFCRLSRKETRTALKHLQNLQCVAIRRASRYSLLVIENWAAYQSDEQAEGQESGRKRAKSGPDVGHEWAIEEEVKKGRRETPPTPETGAAREIPTDPDSLPFATSLDPLPPEPLNGNHHTGSKNGNGHGAATVTDALQRIARQIHQRHPKPRRDIGTGQVEKQLAAILKHQKIPLHEQISYLERIDRNHAGRCATGDWQKDGGEFAKALENWLAPTKGRYEVEPPAPGQAEPPRMVL